MRRRIKRASLRLLESRLFWAALVTIVFAANAVWCFRNRVNGDVAWYLYAVTRLRDGAALYSDIHDINLPLVYLIYLPLAWLSKLSGASISILMYGAVWSLVAGVLAVIYRTPEISSMGRKLMLLVCAYAALSVHRRDLGQRDPICAVLFTLLVISTYVQLKGRSRRPWATWVMILAAAVGIAIKPYFLIPWMLVAGFVALYTGIRAAIRMPEVWLPLVVSIISWAVTLVAFPNYLAMASVASRYYRFLNGSPWLLAPLLIPATIAVAAFARKCGRIQPLVHLSALATAGFVIECLAQRKAFPYHLAPAMLWCVITCGLIMVDVLQRSSGQPASWGGPVIVLLGSFWLAGNSLWSAIIPPPEFARTTVDEFVSAHARGKLVLSLSTDLWTAYPLILEAGARNARPDASLWTIAGLYQDQVTRAADSPMPLPARYHVRAEMGEDERASFDEVVSILTKSRPAIVLVQLGRWKQGLHGLEFDFLEYFGSDPRFREAMHSYRCGPSDEKRLVLIHQGF